MKRCYMENGENEVTFCVAAHSTEGCAMNCSYGRELHRLRLKENAENYHDWILRKEEKE